MNDPTLKLMHCGSFPPQSAHFLFGTFLLILRNCSVGSPPPASCCFRRPLEYALDAAVLEDPGLANMVGSSSSSKVVR